MDTPAVDHRRAIAERNAAAVLDATERLLAAGAGLNMRAIAVEAGVSRPTLYAHYRTIGEVVEAAVRRAVAASVAAIEAAEPDAGPAADALDRMVAASWGQIARFDALARGAAEHISSGALNRAHAPVMGHVRRVIERGRDEGAFRTDVPLDWQVTMYFTLIHGADGHARAHRLGRDAALELLMTTFHAAFGP